jgi:hypothetical protein
MTRLMNSLRWWALAAAAAVVVVIAALGLMRQPSQPAVATPPDAGEACPDEGLIPGPVLEGGNTSPLLLVGEGVRFTVDGQSALSTPDHPTRYASGTHVVGATRPGSEPLTVKVELGLFRPAALLVAADGALLVPVLLGATCRSCPTAQGSASLDDGATPADLDAAAKRASLGDWVGAREQLAGATAAARRTPRFTWLSMSVWSLTGLPSKVLEASKRLPRPTLTVMEPVLQALEELPSGEDARHGALVVSRWNALTERWSRLVVRFGTDGAGPMASAAARFSRLSETFQKASAEKDLIAQESTTEGAQRVLTTLVSELRALKPHDCAWQAAVTQAM